MALNINYMLYHSKLFHQTAATAWFVDYVCGEVSDPEPAGYLGHHEDWEGKSKTPMEFLLANLKTRYPSIGLTFGYHGNVGKGYGTYADLHWSFFTEVWDQHPKALYANCHAFPVGLTEEKTKWENSGDLSELSLRLTRWIENKVLADVGKPSRRSIEGYW